MAGEAPPPGKLERHLEFLGFNESEGLLLGCSDLTGRRWVGSVWYYPDPSAAPDPSGEGAVVLDCDDGVVDGLFLEENLALIGLDSGSLETLTRKEGYLERISVVNEHDDIITGLARSPDKVITSSYDKTIVVYDIQASLSLDTRLKTPDLIADVASNPLDPAIIASAGCDGIVSIWDLRSRSSPTFAYVNYSDWPTALAWSPQDDKTLIVGSQTGKIGRYDLRNVGAPATDTHDSIDKQIHKILFSPSIPDVFAVSADTFPVRIFSIDGFKKLYEDERHEDFVRGLAWHPQTEELWTCGWDHLILSHSLKKCDT